MLMIEIHFEPEKQMQLNIYVNRHNTYKSGMCPLTWRAIVKKTTLMSTKYLHCSSFDVHSYFTF